MATPMDDRRRQLNRSGTKKSHSWWWDSHISPKNSQWLKDNLVVMDDKVKRMLKLIEEDAVSFKEKAEMYFQKRPQLLDLLGEVYGMYRSLVERYDNARGELDKNVPLDLRSQGSGVWDANEKMNSLEEEIGRLKIELQTNGIELGESRGRRLESDGEDTDVSNAKYMMLEEELRIEKRKTEDFAEEISRLKIELQTYQSSENTNGIGLAEEEIRCLRRDNKVADEKLHELQNQIELAQGEIGRLNEETNVLRAERDGLCGKIVLMEKRMEELQMEDVKLISAAGEERKAVEEMRRRVEELEEEVERQRATITDAAEEKREAIRQLLLTLDRYSNGRMGT